VTCFWVHRPALSPGVWRLRRDRRCAVLAFTVAYGLLIFGSRAQVPEAEVYFLLVAYRRLYLLLYKLPFVQYYAHPARFNRVPVMPVLLC